MSSLANGKDMSSKFNYIFYRLTQTKLNLLETKNSDVAWPYHRATARQDEPIQ